MGINISEEELDEIIHRKIEIIDNGIGIHDSWKAKVFQRSFENVDNLSGTGLGLTLVNAIIQYFNGKIWVEDKIKDDYSKGSKFIVLIPQSTNSSIKKYLLID